MEWKREMIAEGCPGGQVGSEFPHFQLRELACSHRPSWGYTHVNMHTDMEAYMLITSHLYAHMCTSRAT